jgi:exodeoxyribonuclease VII large subunit
VADVFVETPSAAAKIIVDKRNALLAQLDGIRQEMGFSISETINRLNNTLVALRHMLKSPQDRLQEKQQLLDELNVALRHNMRHYLNITREKASSLIDRLEVLSPLAVLSRGYSLSMLMPQGAIIKDAKDLNRGDKVKTILSKGAFIGSVEEVIKDERKTVI